jgi:hypothetical protein
MADIFQGSLLPSTVSTIDQQATAPEFYTNYLQDIANLGQNAVNQGGVAGFSPLQQQAFQMAPDASFAGANTMGAGAQLAGQAGATTAPDVIQNYMNPYQHNVVDEMGRLQQQNIQRNVMPALNAAGAGSGGFGSRRQAQATGQTLADMQANLTGQQQGALATGYNQAMASAQTDLSRALQSGQALGTLGGQQNQLAQTGLQNLSTLGGQQQALGKKMLDMPMTQAQNFSKLLQGYQVPMGQVQQTVAPGQQGQFTNSPLSQIAGLGTMLAALMGNPDQQSLQAAQQQQATAMAQYYANLAAKNAGTV